MPQFTTAQLRRYATVSEKILWDHLRARQLMGSKFRRQHAIGRTIVDFVCIKEKLIIELDGPVHDKRKAYDERRDAWLRSQGYRVIRFKNEDLEQTPVKVIEQIKSVLRYSMKTRFERLHP